MRSAGRGGAFLAAAALPAMMVLSSRRWCCSSRGAVKRSYSGHRSSFAAAFSQSSSSRTEHLGKVGKDYYSRRVFVGDLTTLGRDEAALRTEFEKYGPVSEIAMPPPNDEKARPFAFVEFGDAASAKKALLAHHAGTDSDPKRGDDLFGAVEEARRPEVRPKSEARRERAAARAELVSRLAARSNVVIQGPKSHMARLSEYIESRARSTYGPSRLDRYHCDAVGELDPGRRSVGLLFLRADHPARFAHDILNDRHASIAINKLYMVDGGAALQASNTGDVAEEALRRLKYCVDNDNDIRAPHQYRHGTNTTHAKRQPGRWPTEQIAVRVQAFPPKLRSDLIAAMGPLWNDRELGGAIMSPTNFTHTLSIVEVQKPSNDGELHGIYMMGVSEAMPTDAVSTHDRGRFGADNGGDVCRAYYKLQEALGRYKHAPFPNQPTTSSPAGSRSVALDCGASPGGWTKYLAEEAGCTTVHSVDPGELDPIVRDLDGVRHWKTTIGDALPLLEAEGVRVDVWTSDMCLHEMSEQINWLLRAKEYGVLSPDALFVLTLKCNVGHSKDSYDGQVRREVDRLDGMATNVKIVHLFSNCSGERTVVGNIN